MGELRLSNIPISSLPIAVSLDGSEYTDLVQAGTTKRAQISLINSINPANLPAGGITGQALVKLSNVNYATTWKTLSGGCTAPIAKSGRQYCCGALEDIAAGPVSATQCTQARPKAAMAVGISRSASSGCN
jgi:hypothetical protein